MYNILLLNKIAQCGTDLFDRSKYAVGDSIENPDAILVRSASMHDMPLGENLRAIARAGAGVNNIPLEQCADAGIVVFNTPGANANAVKELVIAGLMLASRDITDGINWANTLKDTPEATVAKQVEKGKSRFAGHEIAGKRLGVIGLGAIGVLVANAAVALGMEVVGYDKFLTVESAWKLSRSIRRAASMDEIFASCDYITLHIPATPETKGTLCAASIAKMKDGVRLLNFSRADLAVAADIKTGLESGKIAKYVTDFPTEEILGAKNLIAIPHLGASTEESEDNCAVMAVNELRDFLEMGNITHSVNYPDVSLPHSGDLRICLCHKNIPAMLTQITAVLAQENINIENMVNRSKKEYAYTIVEIIGEIPQDTAERLRAIDGIIRVNILR